MFMENSIVCSEMDVIYGSIKNVQVLLKDSMNCYKKNKRKKVGT